MTLLGLPAWMDILVNVIGYAGFIGIATWHANFARWPMLSRAPEPSRATEAARVVEPARSPEPTRHVDYRWEATRSLF